MKGQTDCPSFVSFSVREGFVSYSQGNFIHNHEVSKEFTLAARSCYTADELERMNYFQTIGLPAEKIRSILNLTSLPNHFYDARRKTIKALKVDSIPILISTIKKWKDWKLITHNTQTNGIEKLCSITIVNMKIVGSIYSSDIGIVDDTSCTNPFDLSLEAIVIVDYDSRSHILAFGAIPDKSSEGYKLFFKDIKSINNSDFRLFVMDRSPAQLNAIKNVYPNSNYIFCAFHMKRNVSDKLNGEIVSKFAELIDDVIDEDEFNLFLNENITSFNDNKLLYIADLFHEKDNWIPYKTKMLFSFGNTTSNRVEGLFGTFKRQILHQIAPLLEIFLAIARLETIALTHQLKSRILTSHDDTELLLSNSDCKVIGECGKLTANNEYYLLQEEYLKLISACHAFPELHIHLCDYLASI